METEKKIDITALLVMLHLRGIKEVVVYYDGSGDSGIIDTVTPRYFPSKLDRAIISSKLPAEQVVEDNPPLSSVEIELLRSWAGEALERSDVGDWWNDDGAYGYIYLDCALKQARIDHHQRMTSTEDSVHEVEA